MREAHKRNRNPAYKTKYRVKNWSQYDKALRNRGDITLWFSTEAIKAWTPKPNGGRGRQQRYSDLAIETVLTLRLLFHLPLRQAKGFVHSILGMMDLELPTPDHTTLSRRSSSLKPIMNCHAQLGEPIHLIVDSTGLSIHGEGPWSRHKLGKKRRRGWRKLHVLVDQNGLLLATSVSKETTRDASRVPHLFDHYRGQADSFTGDRGYDQASVYREALGRNHEASIVIHPRVNGVHSHRKLELEQRNEHLERIASNGIYRWRRESGYYRQSTVENGFYRYKTIIGRTLRARGDEAREVEAILGCKILNRCLEMGRPDSVRIG